MAWGIVAQFKLSEWRVVFFDQGQAAWEVWSGGGSFAAVQSVGEFRSVWELPSAQFKV